jgi:hypothetical protein
LVVNVKDFFKNNPNFMQNSVLVKNRSDENTILIFGAEWSTPLDDVILYGDDSYRIRRIKNRLAHYYYNNLKLHYYVVYYNDSTTEERNLIDEIYNFLVSAGADVMIKEEFWSR